MDIVPIDETLYDKLQLFCNECNKLGYKNNASFKAMKLEWCKSGDEKKSGKYVGEIKNGKPNGQGTYTSVTDGGVKLVHVGGDTGMG